MPRKLTKRVLDSLRATEQRRVVFDSELAGFGVRVAPSGEKSFVVQYRPPGGRAAPRRHVTIGRFGPLTVEQARAEARKILALVAQGRDPARERAEYGAAPTVNELAPAFLELVQAKRKATTATEYARQMERHILPVLGRKRVAEVMHADVSTLHLGMRTTPYLANRVLALLGAFFQWCESQGHRAAYTNPTRHIEPYPERKRDRYLTPAEFIRIGAQLARAERDGIPPAPRRRRKPVQGPKAKHRPKSAGTPTRANPFAVACIRFLLLSGWRESEARTLQWDALDAEHGVALLTDTKTGRSARPLGAPAFELLDELPRMEGSLYVFPGADPKRPIADLSRLWDAVRHAAKLTDVRLHDLRHAFASVAAGGGLSLPIVGSLLGHRNPSTTQRYAHLAADPVKLAADRTAGEIAALLEWSSARPVERAKSA